jgi:hypothetical protein
MSVNLFFHKMELDFAFSILESLYSKPIAIPSISCTGLIPAASRPFLYPCSTTRKARPVQVTVKPLKGTPFALQIDALDSIQSLKISCGNATQASQKGMRLLLAGKSLVDSKTLFDYGVTESCVISLMTLGSTPIEEIIPEPAQRKETAVENQMDDEVFWAKIKSVLDCRFTMEQSTKIIGSWKQNLGSLL